MVGHCRERATSPAHAFGSLKGKAMNFGMLRYLPRDLVSKLVGVSPSEEEKLFRQVLPRGSEYGGLLYSVTECRERLEEIRRQRLEEIRREELEEIHREELEEIRREPLALVGGLVKEVKTLFDLHGEKLDQACNTVTTNMTALSNVLPHTPHLTVRQVATKAKMTQGKVRRHVRKGDFTKSLLLNSRAKGKWKQFDPSKLWEDIADIKARPKQSRGKRNP